MVKGRQRTYCFVWLLFTTGRDVLFLTTSCLLYTDTVPLNEVSTDLDSGF